MTRQFRVSYKNENHFGFAKEIISVNGGIMQASKIAKDHETALRKTLKNNTIEVYTIKERFIDAD